MAEAQGRILLSTFCGRPHRRSFAPWTREGQNRLKTVGRTFSPKRTHAQPILHTTGPLHTNIGSRWRLRCPPASCQWQRTCTETLRPGPLIFHVDDRTFATEAQPETVWTQNYEQLFTKSSPKINQSNASDSQQARQKHLLSQAMQMEGCGSGAVPGIMITEPTGGISWASPRTEQEWHHCCELPEIAHAVKIVPRANRTYMEDFKAMHSLRSKSKPDADTANDPISLVCAASAFTTIDGFLDGEHSAARHTRVERLGGANSTRLEQNARLVRYT